MYRQEMTKTAFMLVHASYLLKVSGKSPQQCDFSDVDKDDSNLRFKSYLI